MPAGLFAHVVTAGPGVLGLPLWALAYGMAMVVVVAALVLRSSLTHQVTRAKRAAAASDALPRPRRRGARAVAWLARAVLLAGVAVTSWLAWMGPEQQGANAAPLLLFSLFWVGGAWLSVLVGDPWAEWSPFAAVADWSAQGAERRGGRSDRTTRGDDDVGQPDPARAPRDSFGQVAGPPGRSTTGWWWSVAVIGVFAFAWVADPDGAQPRRLAWGLGLFVLLAVVGAWRGRHEFLDRFDPFPLALGFTAWFRPRRSRVHDRALLGVGSVVAAAVVFNRLSRTEAFGSWIGPRSLHVAQLQNALGVAWLAAVVAALVWGLGLLATRLVLDESASRLDEPVELTDDGAAPDGDHEVEEDEAGYAGLRAGLLAAPLLAPVAGMLVLTHTLNTFLVQVQNLAVLASDPLARGWNLFGTIDWRVSQQPLSPVTSAWVQFALIAVGHIAALVVWRDRCVEAATVHPSSPGTAGRAWRAMAPGVVVLVASSIGCTLGLLGT